MIPFLYCIYQIGTFDCNHIFCKNTFGLFPQILVLNESRVFHVKIFQEYMIDIHRSFSINQLPVPLEKSRLDLLYVNCQIFLTIRACFSTSFQSLQFLQTCFLIKVGCGHSFFDNANEDSALFRSGLHCIEYSINNRSSRSINCGGDIRYISRK